MSTTTQTTAPTSVAHPTATASRLRYSPPWPELSPRAGYWYWRLSQVITVGLWIAKKAGRIGGYAMTDVLGPCPEAWPESLDGKHFGRYSVKGCDSTLFYKVGRLVVIVDL